jgi:23S rRNA (cytosine1962-C5)-methyltransferase
MKRLTLKQGREKSLLRRHPWVFSGAVQSVEGSPKPGETVAIHDAQEQFLAWGAYSPTSQIRARVWSWAADAIIDEVFFHHSLSAACRLRESWLDRSKTTAYRLVHAESDGLPGLVVDRYGEVLVVQFLSAGVEHWRDVIVGKLAEMLAPTCIYERSDPAVRQLEGLPLHTGLLYGELTRPLVQIVENGLRFNVDPTHGQKTGFYLDQRDNRQFSAKKSPRASLC